MRGNLGFGLYIIKYHWGEIWGRTPVRWRLGRWWPAPYLETSLAQITCCIQISGKSANLSALKLKLRPRLLMLRLNKSQLANPISSGLPAYWQRGIKLLKFLRVAGALGFKMKLDGWKAFSMSPNTRFSSSTDSWKCIDWTEYFINFKVASKFSVYEFTKSQQGENLYILLCSTSWHGGFLIWMIWHFLAFSSNTKHSEWISFKHISLYTEQLNFILPSSKRYAYQKDEYMELASRSQWLVLVISPTEWKIVFDLVFIKPFLSFRRKK